MTAATRRSLTFTDLKAEFRLCFDSYDPWGSCMSWWFGAAGEMHERGLSIPDEWRYRPSPFGGVDPDAYEAPILAEAEDEALASFGELVARYAEALKRAGKSY